MSAAPDGDDVVYGLEDRPPLPATCLAALQHVLAVFVGIITPPLLIARALGLGLADSSYLVSMSLMVSGVATFIQSRRFGPVGSGLLSIQGTSFAFLGPIIGAGKAAMAARGSAHAALAVIFGVCSAGAFIEIALSRLLRLVQRAITPLVTGIVVTLIGLTLVRVGFTAMCGGASAKADGSFASPQNLGLAALTFGLIIALNRSKRQQLRTSSIVVGLFCGYVVSTALGLIDFSSLSRLGAITVPQPLKYGLGWSWSAFFPIALIYVISAIETIGDLTATSSVSGEPIEGERYLERIRGGVLGDGINSLLAATLATFPNTTFSQNNGVIQLTGVASRYVGYFIAAALVLLGLFPVVAGLLQLMPAAVLGGATLLMFGTVAAAGIRIIASRSLERRAMLVLSIALAAGLGVTFVPESLDHLPAAARSVLRSGVATGGLFAVVGNLLVGPP